jgi:hypothetical protein
VGRVPLTFVVIQYVPVFALCGSPYGHKRAAATIAYCVTSVEVTDALPTGGKRVPAHRKPVCWAVLLSNFKSVRQDAVRTVSGHGPALGSRAAAADCRRNERSVLI